MGAAMQQVRAALGDDAIIVATREEPDGTVRVTAAIEENESGAGYGSGGGAHGGTGGGGRGAPPEPEIDIAEEVADVLYRHGTPAAVAERLVDAITGLDLTDPVDGLSAALDAVFTFQPLAEEGGRPLMLVGPPGAGKTLTAAKLAARAVFRKRPVGVITTDTIRAGGVAQLSAFTRLLKVKLISVDDPLALADALEVTRGVEQIVIDTAGRNPFDPADLAELRQTLQRADVEPVLVLPAGGDAQDTAEIGALYRAIGVRRAIVTRLDLTRRLGGLLAAIYEARLNFCEISNTAKVAEGLTPLTAATLARFLLPPKASPAAQAPPQPAPRAQTREPTREPMREPMREQAREPMRELVREPAREPTRGPSSARDDDAKDAFRDPVREALREAAREAARETAREPARNQPPRDDPRRDETRRDAPRRDETRRDDSPRDVFREAAREALRDPGREPARDQTRDQAREPFRDPMGRRVARPTGTHS